MKGAHITVASKYGERPIMSVGYPKIPDEKTRLTYYVDDALKEKGYNVDLSLNPAGVKVIWDEEQTCSPATAPSPSTSRPPASPKSSGNRTHAVAGSGA